MIKLGWGSGYKVQDCPAYQMLSKEDRLFVCPSTDMFEAISQFGIPHIAYYTQIGGIAPEFIPIICNRYEWRNASDYAKLNRLYGVPLSKYLERFIGVWSNIRTLTTPEFIRHVSDSSKLLPLTSAQIKSVRLNKNSYAALGTL